MITKLENSLKSNRHRAYISIKKSDPSQELSNTLIHKIERDKKLREFKRSKMIDLVERHPNEAVSTLRSWILADN